MRTNVLAFNPQSGKASVDEARLRNALVTMHLFDEQWYCETYADVRLEGGDPLDHFVRFGSRMGRSPHPLFDAQWYLAQNPDVAEHGGSPVLHYIEHGAAEGRDPSPYFSTTFYVQHTPEARHGARNPLAHFIAQWSGGKAVQMRESMAARQHGRSGDPHPLFDMRWYIARHGTTLPLASNPLAFHVAAGYRLDLDPHPLIDCRWYRRAYPGRIGNACVLRDYLSAPAREVRSPSPLFDRQWYHDTYQDAYDGAIDALIDYVTIGRDAGRLPHPMFASDWYAAQNPDAASYPGGPLCHFREVGSALGADPHPMFNTRYFVERHPQALADPCGPVAHYLLADRSAYLQPHPLFDARWYAACNPEVADAPVAPLVHLLGYGIWDNRDPHPLFDCTWYLQTYPQARLPMMHPLAHYLETGAALNYWPTNFFNPEFYASRYPECAGMDPLVHFARWGMELGNLPNEDAVSPLTAPLVPDVYNAGPTTYSRYTRSIGLTARLVLACEAVKKDPVSYAYYFNCLMADCDRWRIPAEKSENPFVSVILPVYNGVHFTIASIASTARFLPDLAFELIVADNVSTDATEATLSGRGDLRYIRHPENLGFLRSCNRAARFARGEFIFLLNNDTIVAPGWLDELYALFCLHDNVGLAGSKLIYPDGRLQEAGGILWQDGSAWNYGKFQDPGHPEFNYVREVDYCSGAAIMVPKRLWDEVGGFDEMYVPSYCEDSDLALRIRSLGYSVLYAPHSVVSHFEGMTQGRDTSSGVKSYQVSNTEKLLARWRPMFSQYQPNGEQLDLAKDRGYFKRALFIDECTPAPKEDAGSVTATNIMRLLQSRGYLVTFIPRSNYLYVNGLTQDLQRDGIEAIYGGFINSVREHLERHGGRYDTIVMMRPQSYSGHIEEIRQYAPQAKLIYHTCDLHYLRVGREAELTGSAETARLADEFKITEFEAISTVDASIVHSTVELEVLRRELPPADNVHLFGWAIPVPGAKRPFEGRKGAVFVGGFNHMPNVDAVLFFAKEVLPIVWRAKPEFVFHVVGSKTPTEIKALASERIIVHGFVDDLEPIFESVQMAVAPLRYGAGIKGKIATAMSVGLPNVVTTVGAEGMGLSDRQNCIIADTPTNMAAAICDIADDKALWTKLSMASAAFCELNYGTTAAEHIFDSILQGAGLTADRTATPRLVSPTGGVAAAHWPATLRPIAIVRDWKDWSYFSTSRDFEIARTRDDYARVRLHDRPELGYPAYDNTTGLRELMLSGDVGLGNDSLQTALISPETDMANIDRLIAALAKQAGQKVTNGDNVVVDVKRLILRNWLTEHFPTVTASSPAALVVSDAYRPMLDDLVAPGGLLIAIADSAATGLAAITRMVKEGWPDAALEVYHDPNYGHLGDDLLVIRATR